MRLSPPAALITHASLHAPRRRRAAPGCTTCLRSAGSPPGGPHPLPHGPRTHTCGPLIGGRRTKLPPLLAPIADDRFFPNLTLQSLMAFILNRIEPCQIQPISHNPPLPPSNPQGQSVVPHPQRVPDQAGRGDGAAARHAARQGLHGVRAARGSAAPRPAAQRSAQRSPRPSALRPPHAAGPRALTASLGARGACHPRKG
jgi:hypothetical protein